MNKKTREQITPEQHQINRAGPDTSTPKNVPRAKRHQKKKPAIQRAS
jgi:hypothetical protein